MELVWICVNLWCCFKNNYLSKYIKIYDLGGSGRAEKDGGF